MTGAPSPPTTVFPVNAPHGAIGVACGPSLVRGAVVSGMGYTMTKVVSFPGALVSVSTVNRPRPLVSA